MEISSYPCGKRHKVQPRTDAIGAGTLADERSASGRAAQAAGHGLTVPGVLTHIEACIPALRRYAAALLRNREDADDLVHDCLVRALDKLDTRRDDADVRPWLFAIMHNLFISQLRRARSRPSSESLDETHEAAMSVHARSGKRSELARPAARPEPAAGRAAHRHPAGVGRGPFLCRGGARARYPGWHGDVAPGARPRAVASDNRGRGSQASPAEGEMNDPGTADLRGGAARLCR